MSDKRTTENFKVVIPSYGEYEVHETCRTLADLIKKDADLLISLGGNLNSNVKVTAKTITSSNKARRNNLERILVYIETHLSYLTMDAAGTEVYQAAVNLIHVTLNKLDDLDTAIDWLWNDLDPEIFLSDPDEFRKNPPIFMPAL